MAEYIKREDALEITKRTSGDYATAFAEIRKIPAADVVSVVHCSECENAENECGGMIICRVYKHIMWLHDFCSYGKRKDGADNA